MSTCPDKDLYSAYVDGELPSPWKEKLEAHFANCAKCAELVNAYNKLKFRICSSPVPPLDLEASFEKLKDKQLKESYIDDYFKEKPSWFYKSIRIPVPAFIAAALFLFVFTPIFVMTNQSKPNNQIIVSNFEPILPVSTVTMKGRNQFNLNELNTLRLSAVKVSVREKRQKISFNQFLNLYLPTNSSKEEDMQYILQNINNNSFLQKNITNFNLDY